MKRTRWAKFILLFILIAPVAVFLFGKLIMLLWNNILTPVLHVSEITFWQGLGILVLVKFFLEVSEAEADQVIIIKKQRMMWNSMTPEQKERFKEEWKNRSRRWGYRSSEPEISQPGGE